MQFVSGIILRYLRARRGFTGVVTGFSVMGILLGVAALIVVMCVMAGFREELIHRILGMNGHATVSIPALDVQTAQDFSTKLTNIDDVTEAYPIIQGQVMVTSHGRTAGALIRGINQLNIPKLVSDNIKEGDIENLLSPNTIAIGDDMADVFGLSEGEIITLISPDGASTIVGFIPRILKVKIGAIFNTGMHGYDKGMILMNIPLAQSLFRMGNMVSAIDVRVKDADKIKDITPSFLTVLGPIARTVTWQDSNQQFFQALQVERITMFVILSLIIIVAAFNIITGQIMLVTDKTSDIAILRTMGATRNSIMRIFLFNGMLLGAAGTLGGFLLGLIIVDNLKPIVKFIETATGSQLFSGDVYPIDTIPSRFVWSDITVIVIISLLLTLLASIYPAWRAAKQEPVEGLRNV